MLHKHISYLASFFLGVFLSVTVNAQPFRMSVQERVQILKDSLNLTQEQEKKITEILTAQQTEAQKMRENFQGDREAARTYMMESMKKTDEQIKAVLTKEQAQKYDAMIKARRERMLQRAPQR